MIIRAHKTFRDVVLTSSDAAYLINNLNHANREVRNEHVARMMEDANSDNRAFLPDLVIIGIAVPSSLSLDGWDSKNILFNLRTLNDSLVGSPYEGKIQLINGGHTCHLAMSSEMNTFRLCFQVYKYTGQDELTVLKISFDKARGRTGKERMVFANSTSDELQKKTGVKLTDQNVRLLNSAVGTIMKGFQPHLTEGHTKEFPLETRDLAIHYIQTAKTYLSKVDEAFRNGSISPTIRKGMKNAGIMGSFLFLMDNDITKGRGFNFLNTVLFKAMIREKSKRSAENFKAWLASEDASINPKTSADRPKADLAAMEYYFNLFSEHEERAVQNIVGGNDFKYRSHVKHQVVFAGLQESDMREYFGPMEQHRNNIKENKKEIRDSQKDL